jgi:hypothetical protein
MNWHGSFVPGATLLLQFGYDLSIDPGKAVRSGKF